MNQQPYTQEALIAAQAALGWDFASSDEFVVEIGGTSIYGIDGAGTKGHQQKALVSTTKTHLL